MKVGDLVKVLVNDWTSEDYDYSPEENFIPAGAHGLVVETVKSDSPEATLASYNTIHKVRLLANDGREVYNFYYASDLELINAG